MLIISSLHSSTSIYTYFPSTSTYTPIINVFNIIMIIHEKKSYKLWHILNNVIQDIVNINMNNNNNNNYYYYYYYYY